MKRRPLNELACDPSGGAAVEFALVTPVLAAILAALVLVWGDLSGASHMRSAVHAGADYIRAGGSDRALVRTVVERAWKEMPEESEITVSESCTCGSVVSSCVVLCPSRLPPSVYFEIHAVTGDADQMLGRTATEVVRVR